MLAGLTWFTLCHGWKAWTSAPWLLRSESWRGTGTTATRRPEGTARTQTISEWHHRDRSATGGKTSACVFEVGRGRPGKCLRPWVGWGPRKTADYNNSNNNMEPPSIPWWLCRKHCNETSALLCFSITSKENNLLKIKYLWTIIEERSMWLEFRGVFRPPQSPATGSSVNRRVELWTQLAQTVNVIWGGFNVEKTDKMLALIRNVRLCLIERLIIAG